MKSQKNDCHTYWKNEPRRNWGEENENARGGGGLRLQFSDFSTPLKKLQYAR